MVPVGLDRLQEIIERRNILKNVVFRIIMELRRKIALPKLNVILNTFKGAKNQEEKQAFVKKLKKIYNLRENC